MSTTIDRNGISSQSESAGGRNASAGEEGLMPDAYNNMLWHEAGSYPSHLQAYTSTYSKIPNT